LAEAFHFLIAVLEGQVKSKNVRTMKGNMINWEILIAILGLIIALSASIATIWQGVLTRRHNKLSVKPFLKTEGNYIPGQKVSITLSNTGFGPAIIKSIQILIDGQVFDSTENQLYPELIKHLDVIT